MKRLAVLILIVCAVVAAAFAWQTSVFAMADEMDGHSMGMDCLAYCLTAGADEADVAAVIVSFFAAAAAVVCWAVFIPAALEATVPTRARPHWDPGRRFIMVKRE